MAAQPLHLRLKTRNGQHTLDNLTEENTVEDLKAIIYSITAISPNNVRVLSGYPPKALDLSDDQLKLQALHFRPKETLLVEEYSGGRPEICDNRRPVSQTTKAPSTKNMNQQKQGNPPQHQQQQQQQPQLGGATSRLIDTRHLRSIRSAKSAAASGGVLMRRVVPANNSCLFTSIYFCLSGGEYNQSLAPALRQIIADTVAADNVMYNEAFLGKPNREYCTWILNEEHWGGAIEMAILSKYYSIEMVAVDAQNVRLNRFGEDMNYSHRILAIYDGIHYDPLMLEQLGNNQANVQTSFPIGDETVLDMALELAREMKASRQYTDVANFTLRCMVCGTRLMGQRGAQAHATETGHINFGEI